MREAEAPGDGAVELVQGWARKEEDIPGYQMPRLRGGILREESIGQFEEHISRREPGPMRGWAQTLTRLRQARASQGVSVRHLGES